MHTRMQQNALKKAKENVSAAKSAVEAAKKDVAAKKQAVKEKDKAYTDACGVLAIAKNITLADAMKTPITEESFTYLNDYVTKINSAKAAYETAKADLAKAKENTAVKKVAYEEAAAKHAETLADLVIAKANYRSL